jgi:hemerythrin superfamily protein
MAAARLFGMRNTTDALELLKMQHDEVEMLIEQIEDNDDADEKAELFQELADKLAAHSTMEEKLFYPAVMGEDTEELLLESTEEHLSVKRVLADMMELDVEDERFDAKLTVLKEQVRHHARDEEEKQLFPKIRREFSKDELAALGNECMAMFEMLIERGEPRMVVPRETREAAELPALH